MTIAIRGPARRRPLLTLPSGEAVDRRIAETQVELDRLHKLRQMIDDITSDGTEVRASQSGGVSDG